jgi:hypothetical protein
MGKHPGFITQMVTGSNQPQVFETHGIDGSGCGPDVAGYGRLI